MAPPTWSDPTTATLLGLAVDLLAGGDRRGVVLIRRVLADECGEDFARTIATALAAGAGTGAFAFLPPPTGRLPAPSDAAGPGAAGGGWAGPGPTAPASDPGPGRDRAAASARSADAPALPSKAPESTRLRASPPLHARLAGLQPPSGVAPPASVGSSPPEPRPRRTVPSGRHGALGSGAPVRPLGSVAPGPAWGPAAGAPPPGRNEGAAGAPPAAAPPDATAPLPARGFISVARLAAHFGVTPKTVYRWMEAGRIRFERRPGGSYRIPAAQFHAGDGIQEGAAAEEE